MTAGGVGSEVTGLLVMWHEGKERNESSQELLWVLIVHLIQTPHFPFHSLYHCCDYLLCSNVLHLILHYGDSSGSSNPQEKQEGGAQSEDPAGVSSEDVSTLLWFNLFVCPML